MAGGGVKGGHVHGATDEFGFQAVENKVHVHDLHATILHLLGFDHETFTFRYAGRDFRLTDVHGKVVRTSWRDPSNGCSFLAHIVVVPLSSLTSAGIASRSMYFHLPVSLLKI